MIKFFVITYLIISVGSFIIWSRTEEKGNWTKTPASSLFRTIGMSFLFPLFFILYAILINLAKILKLEKLEDRLQKLK